MCGWTRFRTRGLTAVVTSAALATACSGRAPSAPEAGQARIRNALSGGVVSSVFFGVQRVDGVAVHAKYDQDREVAVATGRRTLTLRYYSQGLWDEPEGETECSVSLDARAGGVYRVEGQARDGRWRARLVDDRDGAAVDCVFADGATWGAVRGGGTAEVAVRAEPDAAPANAARAGTEPAAAVAPPAPAVAVAARPGSEVAAPAAPVAARANTAAAVPVHEAGTAVAVPRQAAAVAEVEAAADAAGAVGAEPPAVARALDTDRQGAAAAPANTGLLAGVRKVVNRSMDVDWGCQAGYLRARGLTADGTLLLKGSERIRLLGIESVDAAGLDLAGACVRLAFDDETKLAGERDREGRLLAYVFLDDGSFVNEELLRAGDARVAARGPHRYLGAFLAAQSEARDAGRGVWAEP